jgi:hypothetical protein
LPHEKLNFLPKEYSIKRNFEKKASLFKSTLVQEYIVTKYIHLQWLFIGVSSIFIWVSQYRSEDGFARLINQISFTAFDRPWMPDGRVEPPILGGHFFGDWMLNVAWAQTPNCYLIQEFPCQTPPLGNIIFRIFGYLGFGFGFFCWTLVASAMYWFVITKMFPTLSCLTKINIFLVFVLITNGNIVSLDRGSAHYMVFALMLISYFFYENGDKKRALLFILLAISIKPQALLCLVYLLSRKQHRDLVKVTIMALSVNLLSLGLFSGSIFESFKGYLSATRSFTGSPNTLDLIASSDSIIAIVMRWRELFTPNTTTIEFLSRYQDLLILPGLLWILIVSIILIFSKPTPLTSMALSLSMFTFVVPASNSYTLGWVSILALLFLRDKLSNLKDLNENKSRMPQIESNLEDKFIYSILPLITTPFFQLPFNFEIFNKVQPLAIFFLIPFIALVIFSGGQGRFGKKIFK